MKTKLNVLLTGASGGIGFEVLKQLVASSVFDITVFDLKTPQSVKKLLRYSKNVKVVFGDISNEQDVLQVCANQDVVIHLAAVIPPLADEQPALAQRINVQGTQHIIHALEKHSPHAFLLYSSSISIYGDRVVQPNILVTDAAVPSEGDEYAKTKITVEKLIQNSALDWSIFRLCAIMGHHKISKLMFHQPLNTSFEIATLEDTARAFVNAIDKREALKGKIFNLGGGDQCRCTYKEFLERSFKIAGLGKLNFVDKSFADKNFHCGFYADGDELEQILHFRRATLDNYFEKEAEKVSAVKKLATSVFRWSIKNFLQTKSEPLQAHKTKDSKAIQHYFIVKETDFKNIS